MRLEMPVDSFDCTNSEYFCELCSLDFTTQNELEEHTWSMLHNTNLNRKQGRDCVHRCSLCRQEFVGLLEFTGHLHGDSHQEKLHNWRRDQQREWSPEKQQLDSPDQRQGNRPIADWSTDDFSDFVEYFSDHGGEAHMNNNRHRGRGRGPPIPRLMDGAPQSDYRYHDRRRDRREHYQEGGYPSWNDGGRDQMREFRDSPPPPVPEYPGMDYPDQEYDRYHWRRNTDERYNDRYYDHSGYMYPDDGWRPPYDNNQQFRSRRDSQPRRYGDGDLRRNSTSPHNSSRQKLSSVVSSKKQSDKSPSSRNKDTEGSAESRKKQSPRDKEALGKSSPGATSRKASKDKTSSPRANSSSGSSSGKNTRKGTPRKLARPVEESVEKDNDRKSKSPTTEGDSETVTRKVQVDRNNKMEITVMAKEKVVAEPSKEPILSSVFKATKDLPIEESSKSKSKENTAINPSLSSRTNAQGGDPSSARNDVYSSATIRDSSVTIKGDILPSSKEDKTNCHTTDKRDSTLKPSLSSKGGSPPNFDRRQESVIGKDKVETVTDKNQSATSSLEKFPKEKPAPILGKKNNPSDQSTEKANSEENKDTQSCELGADSPSSLTMRSESALNSNSSNGPSFTIDKLSTVSSTREKQSSIGFTQNSSSLMSGSERNKTFGVNVSSQSDQKGDISASSASTISTISSLPWEKREEKLRSLLGIKKEPKDTENQEDSISRSLAKPNTVTTESEKIASVPSHSLSSPKSSFGSGSIKGSSSRHIPGFSQLSLSRPQCSFVHIDGVQCGAATWNKYCSYHQRVFKGDENSTQEQSVNSAVRNASRDETHDRESSTRSQIDISGGTQIFKPIASSNNPNELFGFASGLEGKIGRSSSHLDESKNIQGAKEPEKASEGVTKTGREVDLNSILYTAAGTTGDAPSGKIDLSTTGGSRNLLLRGSSSAINSDRSVGASTVANPGANVGGNIDLSDTVPRPRRLLGYHDTTVESDIDRPGIDLSDTVPNLEGFLALHSSSTVDAKGGSHVDSRTGRSRTYQEGRVAQRGQNTDLSSTIPNREDSSPSIDLNETVPQPVRSRTPHFELKEAHLPNANRQPTTSSLTSGVNSGVIYPLKHSVKVEPEEQRSQASETQNTGMIDLSFSTKLLGLPHSVVAPFNSGNLPPQKPSRESTQSPSEFSTKSSVLSSPRSYAPSSPQSPMFTRRVSSTTPLPTDQSATHGSTISLPSLSLDLSRFNLPPAVRKALAERYSGKKATSTAGDNPVESNDGRRSQPLFSEHRTESSFEPGKKASPLPARLRSRGQRSISLDSPMVRRDFFHTGELPRSKLLETGSTFDANQFFSRRFNNEGLQQAIPRASDIFRESSITTSSNVPVQSSTTLLPFNVHSRDAPSHTRPPAQESTNFLQRRGLIDLSSTSYLKGMPVPSVDHGRIVDGSQLTSDNSRSPVRPSVLQGRGLIDLNTSMEYGARVSATESSDTPPVIKRKRINSWEDSESVSSVSAEKEVKRSKQEEKDNENDKPVTYQSGLNVQELLSIEREEQNQLQNLHAVQARLKSVRSQIQKLCTELDSLSSEEQRITLRMGELRNSRLSILESACYQRQVPLQANTETLSRETSTAATQVGEDDSKSTSFESDTYVDNSRTVGSDHGNSQVIGSSQDVNINAAKSPSNDCREVGMDSEFEITQAELETDSSAFSVTETSQNTIGCTQSPKSVAHSSVITTTRSVSTDETPHGRQTSEKFLEMLFLASKRVAKETSSTSEVQDVKRAGISKQTSTASSDGDAATEHSSLGAADAHSSFSAADTQLIVENPALAKNNQSDQSRAEREAHSKVVSVQPNEQTKSDLVKKVQYLHPQEKSLFRKKSFSDINVSKTIEASRKKIQSVRENMNRWKQQEDSIDTQVSSKGKSSKQRDTLSSSSSANSSEIPSKDKQNPSPLKITIPDKPSPRKTSKELKKSSLFQSGKKDSQGSRKSKAEKLQLRNKKHNQKDAIPSKRRRIDDSSSNDTQNSVPLAEKASSNRRSEVVSAAAHTTTADLWPSGTEEKDEVPTRDVDGRSKSTSSGVHIRPSLPQMPSSTEESVKKTTHNSKDGKKQRGPFATKFVGHKGAVCGLKVYNGNLFTCSADKTTRSFSIQTGECVKLYQGHHQAVNCVEVTEDSGRLFTGSNDQTVRSYDIKTGVCTHRFTFDGRVMCLHAAFDLLFVGLNSGIVASIDLLANQLLERLHCHEPRGVSCLTTATEGQRKLLCCGSFDSTITVRDYKTGLLIRTFNHHNMTVLCMQVVNNILYSGSADMNVQAHNLSTGELIRSFHGHTRSVSGLQVVGRVLVTSCLDKLIRCYDLTTGELLQVYGGQIDMIFSVLVSNGRIFSGGRDGSVVASKLELRVYHPCKWENCDLNFGIVSHLKNHIREYHVMEQGAVETCHWSHCGHQFSRDDDIGAVLKHVLGHVVTKTARKSAG